ncbi:MAG: nickel pincer cofactor biosynthesis protein LarC [Proteobacteria bacterium]|nr:nickel pincer cofactor biosynthesis protein LarC [Pseudomonadota bacterium]MBU1710034.1 nickel pincer cofactor biosynthesis protein LarC [Pseudomonadota bacterium]
MKTAYIDCFSGVSGDMFLGALLDLGLSEAALQADLASLGINGFTLEKFVERDTVIRATRLHVRVQKDQSHRSLSDIQQIITSSSLDDAIKNKSLQVFQILAEAEAKVHGCAVQEVHFHEVGAIDAIVDIVGSVAGLNRLGVDQLICSPLPMPRGWVDCAHGRLPVPAPAVFEILRDVAVYGVDLDQELVTPTGAALVKGLCSSFEKMPPMIIDQVGYGAGSRKLPNQPNLLRIILGRSVEVTEAQVVEVIETHLDDWSPEGFPYLSGKLFEAGALDVALVPIQMKKGRPGFLLRVIGDLAKSFDLRAIIFSETTAIGLRYRRENRVTLPRESGRVDTIYGPVQVKKVETPVGIKMYPEYEDCRRVASERNIPLNEVYRAVGSSPAGSFRKE